jgi:hypothetical protein
VVELLCWIHSVHELPTYTVAVPVDASVAALASPVIVGDAHSNLDDFNM